MKRSLSTIRSTLVLALALATACGSGGGGTPAADVGPGEDGTIATPDAVEDPGLPADPGATADPGIALDPGTTADPGPGDAAGDTVVVDTPKDPGWADWTPDGPGPWEWTVVTATVTRGDRDIPVAAHVPQRKDGRLAPVLILLPGYQIASDAYAGTADHLASHGVAVVRADPPATMSDTDHVAMTADVLAVLDWAAGASSPLSGVADLERLGVAGHSLGGKIATMAAFADPRVKVLFGIDPVNGGNPFTGFSEKLPDIVPEQVAPLAIPVGFAGETTDAAPGQFGQACAPKEGNYETFWDAATASPWAVRWDFAQANHMSFLDDPDCGLVCSICNAAPGDPAEALAALRTLLAAFARRHLDGDAAMDDWLYGALVPAGVGVAQRIGR